MQPTLQDAKDFMRVIHSDDDDLITDLLAAAQDEALKFIEDTTDYSSSNAVMADSVRLAILLLTQAAYESTPDDMADLRVIAETKLMPYRANMGL